MQKGCSEKPPKATAQQPKCPKLGTPKGHKHKHFIGISLIGLQYKRVYVGCPHPYFGFICFFGALLKTPVPSEEVGQGQGQVCHFLGLHTGLTDGFAGLADFS